MTDRNDKPGAGTPGLDRQTETKLPEIIPQDDSLFPRFFLPRHIQSKLLKIAAFWGIPAQILAESEITKFVLRNWNRTENSPAKENQNDAF